MEIKLVGWTEKPLATIYWAFMNMHNFIPSALGDYGKLSEEELKDFFDMLFKQPHQTVLEFVKTTWLLRGVSRAFQQQLTRTRLASYSIQSLRVVEVGDFADEKRYHIPRGIKNDPALLTVYDNSMREIQKMYRKLKAIGAETEDARGVLPLNIHSTITMAIDLRSLYHLLELRFCENTQEEFRLVAEAMREEIKKIDPILARPMVPICFAKGYCPSPVPCDKYGYSPKIKKDVSRWIKG